MAFVGANKAEMSEFLGVSLDVLTRWIKEHPEFAEAVSAAEDADNRVKRALYRRAVGGVTVREEKYIEMTQVDDDGNPIQGAEAVVAPMKEVRLKELPADVGAAQFWLKNRMPDEFSEKVEVGFEAVDLAKALVDGRRRAREKRKQGEESAE